MSDRLPDEVAADVLLAIAAHLDAYGWCQRTDHNGEGAACLRGAILDLTPFDAASELVAEQPGLVRAHVWDRLTRWVGGSIVAWNDRDGRTADEVKAACVAAAAMSVKANLRYADLRDANLEDANLWGADLWGANLRGANLWGAVGLTKAQLATASYADGEKFRCSCGAIGHGWGTQTTAAIDAQRHEAEAERDEARARAEAAEQENARLRAGIEDEATYAVLTHTAVQERLRALLAGPEGTDQ